MIVVDCHTHLGNDIYAGQWSAEAGHAAADEYARVMRAAGVTDARAAPFHRDAARHVVRRRPAPRERERRIGRWRACGAFGRAWLHAPCTHCTRELAGRVFTWHVL
jgi:hypothetical protein